MYHIATQKLVTVTKFVVLPMPDAIIDLLNARAARQGYLLRGHEPTTGHLYEDYDDSDDDDPSDSLMPSLLPDIVLIGGNEIPHLNVPNIYGDAGVEMMPPNSTPAVRIPIASPNESNRLAGGGGNQPIQAQDAGIQPQRLFLTGGC